LKVIRSTYVNKNRLLINIWLLFIGGFFLMFLSAGSAKAYTIENFQENVEDRFIISPVNLELNLAPGETSTQQVMIINRLGKTAKFNILKEDFVGSDDPEKISVFLGEESAGITSARDWVKPEIEEITLSHGDRLTLPVNITVPENAVAGSHYAALFASVTSAEESGDKASKVQLVSRVGCLLLINVPGKNTDTGEIAEFKSDRNFYRNGPVEFSAVFKNTGNVYQKVKGEVAIQNFLGATVARVPLKDWIVLSQSSRRQKTEWAKKWLCGRYTARLSLFYGLGGNLSASRDVVFWAFPWHVAILAFIILIMIYYLLRYFFSRFEIKRKE
jgi:hypothetical protein